MNKTAVVILAAGKGVRMKSALPKVLHEVAGETMLHAVCRAARAVTDDICIVVGNGAEQVRAAMGEDYRYALQEQQLGTGHAVMQALPELVPMPERIVVLAGDTPLLTGATLCALTGHHLTSKADCTVLTAVLPDAGGYGRIVRGVDGRVEAIVEARDATPDQLSLHEFNSGMYCFNGEALVMALSGLTTNNSQGEYYLTDAVQAIKSFGGRVEALICEDADEVAGVNDRIQLAAANKVRFTRKARALMLSGVTIVDPDTAYIADSVTVEPDTVLEPQVWLSGTTVIGRGCHIGPSVKMHDAQVGNGCNVGPFAYLRPGTVLSDQVKAGHFVEIKNSVIGHGSKVPHLSYIGDAELGERVNIGCGTITCNYDGRNKHKTIIGDNVFVGSNTNFVAPITIGDRVVIGAGSTITHDVPPDSLAIARERQRIIEEWCKTNDPRFTEKDKK